MDDLDFLQDSFDLKASKKMDARALPTVYLIEDDIVLGRTIKKYVEKKFPVSVIHFIAPMLLVEYLQQSKSKENFILITDISFGDSACDGLFLIDLLKERKFNFESVVITGFGSIETAIQATKKGVFQYLTKPFTPETIEELLQKILLQKFNLDLTQTHTKQSTRAKLFSLSPIKDSDVFCGIIGRSIAMQDVFERIKKVASTDSTVLITGASGTGKELVARAIHSLSQRSNNRLVSVNCGAIPSELLESELFGHVKGAFTGAVSSRKGRFELADRGSIFLDEIGDMPLSLQVKILRVLQNREIELVGGQETVRVDARIITATHRDLDKLVHEGNFREDLFYRLNVIPIRVPSLCERREDIPLLISYFIEKFASADGRNKIEFSDSALEALVGHPWQGNVRELENLIERLIILKGGSLVDIDDLPAKFLELRPRGFGAKKIIDLPQDGIDLKNFLSDIEDSLIEQALERTGGNKNQASKLLQLNRTTLIEKLKKKGVSLDLL